MRLVRIVAAAAVLLSTAPAGIAAATPDQSMPLHLIRGGGFGGGHGGGFGGHVGGFGGRVGGYRGGYAVNRGWGYRPWGYGYGAGVYPYAYACPYPYAYGYPYCVM
jgi:hypothetical protein